MNNTTKNLDALDYFISGVPAGSLYEMSRLDLLELLEVKLAPILTDITRNELCYIGLIAYFEGFCKNNFAALLNICPQLTTQLINKNIDFNLNLNDISVVNYDINTKIGSIISEKINFGSAKKINHYYKSLFNISPFTENDAKKYNLILEDRNLLVHHTGIYTTRYRKNNNPKKTFIGRTFLDSLVINKKDFVDLDKFLQNIVNKIIINSKKNLNEFVIENKIKLSDGQKKAIDFYKIGL